MFDCREIDSRLMCSHAGLMWLVESEGRGSSGFIDLRPSPSEVQLSDQISPSLIIVLTLITGVGQQEVPAQATSSSHSAFHWLKLGDGALDYRLVRNPWTLIQLKETACVLHATAAGKQEAFIAFLSNPAAIFSALPGGVLLLLLLQILAVTCCTPGVSHSLSDQVRLDCMCKCRKECRRTSHRANIFKKWLLSVDQFHLVLDCESLNVWMKSHQRCC